MMDESIYIKGMKLSQAEVDALRRHPEEFGLSGEVISDLDAPHAEANEAYTDEFGTVWTRPTAEAYALACKALHAKEARCKQLEASLAHYRWRPISEIHEDYGECVLMNLNDPGRLEIGNNCSHGFIADDWTHFAEVPKLTHEEAAVLAATHEEPK